MRNLKLILSYDGSEFSGWQVQPDAATVQGTLALAIGRITGEKVLPQGSGRTDAGVHALAQVVTFVAESSVPKENFVKASTIFCLRLFAFLRSTRCPPNSTRGTPPMQRRTATGSTGDRSVHHFLHATYGTTPIGSTKTRCARLRARLSAKKTSHPLPQSIPSAGVTENQFQMCVRFFRRCGNE